MTDAEFDNIKKIFDLKAGPSDYETRMKTGLVNIFIYIVQYSTVQYIIVHLYLYVTEK